jgi:rhodanese-related sulfurtransferase
LKSLNSEHAVYIDVTEAHEVDSEHSYYKGSAVKNNADLKALFNDLFTGYSVEKRLSYFAANNYFKLK